MSKKLRRFGDIPKGGLISYPKSDGKLYHVLEHRGRMEDDVKSGIIAEHIPFDEVIQDGVRIHQSICSHIAEEEDCPDMVWHHEACDCCGDFIITDHLKMIEKRINQSEYRIKDAIINMECNLMDELFPTLLKIRKMLKRLIKWR